ncbi:MAG: NlpC/P60 family protein [Muribaculaceae bacterium]|nr:NlpC/P60 family protein [Muribaculaceae bacterium]
MASTQSLTVFNAHDYIDGHHLNKKQTAIIEEICSWQGTPYKYGGADKLEGTDCSGLILRVFLDVMEIKMPRNSAAQADFCKSVKQSSIKPCDLVFFATGSDPDRVSHVGLMLNEECFIHSSSSKGVIITRLDSPWWNKRILSFGRVPGVN